MKFPSKITIFSRYPSFSPFERPDAYKCYTFSESYGSRETRDIKSSTSKFDIEAGGILSSLWTQTGPWSDTASKLNLPRTVRWTASLEKNQGKTLSYLSTQRLIHLKLHLVI